MRSHPSTFKPAIPYTTDEVFISTKETTLPETVLQHCYFIRYQLPWSKFPSICCFSSAVCAEIGCDSVRQGLNTLLFTLEFMAESRGVEIKAAWRKVKVGRQLLLQWDTGFCIWDTGNEILALSAVTLFGEGWKKLLWMWIVTKSCKYLHLLFPHGAFEQQFGNNLVPEHRSLERVSRPFTLSW